MKKASIYMKHCKTIKILISTPLLLFYFCFSTLSQPLADSQTVSEKGKGNWIVKKPFEHKVFVENLGQFDGNDLLPGSKILYGIYNQNKQIYFTKKGVAYRMDKIQKESKTEKKRKGREEEEEEYKHKVNSYMIRMEWENTSPNARVIASDPISAYFNYAPDNEHKYDHARGFEKLLYKDIYPGIDLEYVFHHTEGIKYIFIVHPGADPSVIKMKYSGADKIYQDKQGNVHFVTPMGDVIDHAPVTNYISDQNSIIPSSFNINGNTVTFKLADYDHSKIIKIDPWVITPLIMPTNNDAYRIAKDPSGNVFIYGGQVPFLLHKYSPAGTLLWVFAAPTTSLLFGDLAVDNAGNAYITLNGYMARVNPGGIADWVNTTGYPNESWCLVFNCIKTELYVGGGPATPVAPVNMTTGVFGTVIEVPGGANEIRGFTGSPGANYFALTVDPGNKIKGMSSTFASLFQTNSGLIVNYTGPSYLETSAIDRSGINSITADNDFIYTNYGNSTIQNTLNKWNILTGLLVGSAPVAGSGYEQNDGIAVDSCGNVYVGSQNSIKKYNSSLAFVSSTATPERVYDLVIGTGGEVIACGNNFVGSFAVGTCADLQCFTPTVSSPVGICIGDSATLTAGTGLMTTYSWAPATGLSTTTGSTVKASPASTTTYTVTATPGSGGNATATVTVTVGPAINLNTSSTGTTCGADNGSASVIVTSGTAPFTYAWSPGGGTDSTASNLAAGVYTVTVTDAIGCTETGTAIVPSAGGLSAAISSLTNVSCNGGSNGSATVTASGGTIPYSYSWLPGGGTGSTASGLPAGNYNVTVTDADNCTFTATANVTEPPAITLLTSATPTTCGNSNGSATVSASGGNAPYAYLWSPTGGTADTAKNLAVGAYTITVTDGNACSQSAVVNVIAPSGSLSTTISSANTTCNAINDGSAVVSAVGGSTPYTYLWLPTGGTADTAKNLAAGTYTVTVTDDDGCVQTETVTITGLTPIIANFDMTPQSSSISNPLINFTDQSVGAVQWQWNFGDILNSGATVKDPSFTYSEAGSYIVNLLVTNSGGCTDAVSHTMIIKPDFIIYIPNAFTPYNPNGLNDFFAPKGSGINLDLEGNFEMAIFNRWGKEIYHTTDINKPWTGNSQNGSEVAQEDVYVYKVWVKDTRGKTHYYIGHVTLIK